MAKKNLDADDVLQAATSVIEAAVHNQETADALLAKLRTTLRALEAETRDLPRKVSEKVEQQMQAAANNAADKIVEKFSAANLTAIKAAKAYEKSIQAGPKQVMLFAIAGLALFGAVIFASAVFYVQSLDAIQQKRQERDLLIEQIQNYQILSRIDYMYCGQSLCVKLDKHLKPNRYGYYPVSLRN
ncbi:hypothetical protein [Herbaspirillum camelliae]|uniref:hypothetical protein n=1 Tax=Herbaspirillum camelliae TaxID=1892903 RepID=UPI000949D588|nr:hypothetical protein [Herbaspirillum camelliae]